MIIEIQGVENGDLAFPVNNTVVHHMVFLAADTRLCVIMTSCNLCIISYSVKWLLHRAGGISPAAPVLAGPVFLKVKTKFNFCKMQVINKVLV